ncbi:TIGR00299 family protein [Leptolyngbyaceae cyanobacterium JSC-12]|nr:TIGR00299 family protein [Leptolyngbyaceae cyanobacterium JSC-12]
MKIAYLQCPTGIAGDMCLGALVDVGVPIEFLVEQLNKLGISQEYKLWTESVRRNGLQATKFHVDLMFESGEAVNPDTFNTFDHAHHHSHPHSHFHPHQPDGSHRDRTMVPIRHLPEIEHLILNAKLPPRAEAWSLAVFRKLAEAEGAVHGVPPEQVHFHEVGATDALVDIIGTCLGLDWLGIERLVCSPLPTGGGTIWAAHGRLPVPTPAVLKLFEMGHVPVYSNDIEREMVTPTGAAIATTLADQFGAPPPMTLQRVGLGAGSRDFEIANILRLWVGEESGMGHRESGVRSQKSEVRSQKSEGKGDSGEEAGREAKERKEGISPKATLPAPSPLSPSSLSLSSSSPNPSAPPPSTQIEQVAVLETQIDDLNPQAIGYVLERLLETGALDAFTQAIGMKKSRPGTLLTVVCRPEDTAICEAIMFRETTTLGIRQVLQQRHALPREIQSVQTEYGVVRVKVAWAKGRDRPPTNVQPEYEDCAHLARQYNLAWREVHHAALQSWYQKVTPSNNAKSTPKEKY